MASVCATGVQRATGLVEPTHALLQTHERHVQVSRRLLQVLGGRACAVLRVVQWPPGLVDPVNSDCRLHSDRVAIAPTRAFVCAMADKRRSHFPSLIRRPAQRYPPARLSFHTGGLLCRVAPLARADDHLGELVLFELMTFFAFHNFLLCTFHFELRLWRPRAELNCRPRA